MGKISPTGTRRRSSRGKINSDIGRERKKLQVRGAQAAGSGGVPGGTSELHGAQATKQMDFLRSRLGFTLLELMISITMLVIIIVIISGAMRLASRSVATAEKKVEALERLTTSLSIINAQIQSAAPWTYSDNGLSSQASQGTQGTSDSLSPARPPSPLRVLRQLSLARVSQALKQLRVPRVARISRGLQNSISRGTGGPSSFPPIIPCGADRRAT